MSEPTETDVPPITLLDPMQCLKYSFDESRRRIRVDTEVSAFISGQQEVEIDHSEDSIQLYGQDGTATHKAILTDSSGHLDIVGTISSIQSGNWYARILDSSGNSLSSLAGSLYVNITNTVPVSQSGTWNINNISGTITLPTGAASSALQITGNASLASIDSDIDVTLSSRASEVTLSSLNSKVSDDYGSSSGAIRTASQIGNSTGSANFGSGITTSQTLRTVIATDQTVIPVSGPLTDAQLRATPVPISGTVTSNIGTSGSLALEATQTAQSILYGAVTETAPATDTASSGLNGRLQRIAQRLTSLITTMGTPSQEHTTAVSPSSTRLSDGVVFYDARSIRALTSADVVTANAGTNLNTSALSLESTQSAQSTLYGAITETAPASDTASSGLNGRLQRIAQRLTSILASIGTTSAAVPTSAIQIGLNDGTNLVAGNGRIATPTLATFGQVVRPIPYEPETFSATATMFVIPAAATDIFAIKGSASKTIRVFSMRVSATTTSGVAIKTTFSIVRRSTANTGGAPIAATVVKYDTNNAAGTATVDHYTTNPTTGTLVGTVRSFTDSVTNSGIFSSEIIWKFEPPLILRGVTEQLAVNLNGASVLGSLFSCVAEWSEV